MHIGLTRTELQELIYRTVDANGMATATGETAALEGGHMLYGSRSLHVCALHYPAALYRQLTGEQSVCLAA